MIDNNFNARIGDFGLTDVISVMSRRIKRLPLDSTIRWVAPEELEDGRGSSMEIDVFLFGIVAYEVEHLCYIISCSDSGLKCYQVFAGYPLPKRPITLYRVIMKKFLRGDVPLRPLLGKRLGLDDEVWNVIQECLDLEPEARPTIKDVRSFLEPRHQKWIPPSSYGAVKSDPFCWQDEDESYTNFTRDSDDITPSHSCSIPRTTLWDSLLASGESLDNAPSPEPALVHARTQEWVLSQNQRSDSLSTIKISRPGVTFEENPVAPDIAPRVPSGTHDITIEPSEPWTHLL